MHKSLMCTLNQIIVFFSLTIVRIICLPPWAQYWKRTGRYCVFVCSGACVSTTVYPLIRPYTSFKYLKRLCYSSSSVFKFLFQIYIVIRIHSLHDFSCQEHHLSTANVQSTNKILVNLYLCFSYYFLYLRVLLVLCIFIGKLSSMKTVDIILCFVTF